MGIPSTLLRKGKTMNTTSALNSTGILKTTSIPKTAGAISEGTGPKIQQQIHELKGRLYDESYQKLCVSNDRVFAALMAFQWVGSIILALVVSPRTWLGQYSQTHIHVWTALVLGGALSSLPIYLGVFQPGAVINRYVNVIAQGLYSALLIHLTGGRIETHFHVFGSLAFFAFYRDIRVLLAGTVVVAVDHAIRGVFYPQSAFGVFTETNWRWLEHASWVIFEDFFLAYSILWSQKEMRIVAEKQAEVEVYNQIIEEQVKARTLELNEEKNSVKMLLDNAAQGFMSFNPEGVIDKQCSSAVKAIFGMDPAGKHIAVIFRQPEEAWAEYVRILFEEALPFIDLVNVCPKSVTANGRSVELHYQAVRGETQKIRQIMVVATDVTDLRALEQKRENEQQTNRALIKILGMKNDFVELIEILGDLEKRSGDENEAKRTLHTLKGGFAFLECRQFAELCHHWEDRLKQGFTARLFIEGAKAIRAKVDAFLSENDKLLGLKGKTRKVISVEVDSIETVIRQASELRAPAQVLDSLEKLAEQPAVECLGWLSDAFVVTAERLGKEVEPITWESSVAICSDLYKGLFKSLIHVPRNSADHGIESPDERVMLGKPRTGKMTASLTLKGNRYTLRFRDDGAGVDLATVKAKARSMNLSIPQDDADVVDLLFQDGLSTKENVTETSGRGVGLDAIRAEARRLGGDAKGVNFPGKGFEIIISFDKVERRVNPSSTAVSVA